MGSWAGGFVFNLLLCGAGCMLWAMKSERPTKDSWRKSLHEIIFEAETPAGKAFDVGLLIAIVLSVVAVCIESVTSYRIAYGGWLRAFEWGFTILFTIEYGLRFMAVRRPFRYVFSFLGLVDL